MKMIVMDMDGTLLTQNQQILPYTKEVLMNLQKQDISLVLASGRDISSLEYYGKQLDMDQYPQSGYIVLNGLEIYNSQRECLYFQQRLNKQDLIDLNEIAKASSFMMIVFFETCLYLFHCGENNIFENQFIDRPKHVATDINEVPEHLFSTIKKVAFVQREEVIKKTIPALQKQMASRFSICQVEKNWVEVNPAHASKGQALCHLSKLMNIPLEEVVAFGNGENDMDMLLIAGVGVAMDNAFETVKRIADDICGDNEHDGIAHYLHQYMTHNEKD